MPQALITGGGQGLGYSIAQTLAARGWGLHLLGREAHKLEQAAQDMAQAGAPQVAYTPLDLAQPDAIAALPQRLNSLDALVNCAAESFIAPLEQTTLEDWERLQHINLRAPFLLAQTCLPLLRRSANPSILNIGSLTAHGGYAGVSAYSAAKTGLLGLTRALAAELRPQIRVVFLSPGPMDTPMRWQATPDFDRQMVIAPQVVAAWAAQVLELPAGVTSSDVILHASGLEM